MEPGSVLKVWKVRDKPGNKDRLPWPPQFYALLKPRVHQGSHGPRGKTAAWGCLRSCPRGPPGGPKGLQQEEAGGSKGHLGWGGSWASERAAVTHLKETVRGHLWGVKGHVSKTHTKVLQERKSQHSMPPESSTGKKLRSHIACASVSMQSVPE